jgi:type IV fimbrial biogenesis protein FimT
MRCLFKGLNDVKDSRSPSSCSPATAPFCQNARNQRAFSLHEVLVTLVVTSTLIMVGIPSLQQMIGRQQVSTAANSFITALYTARSEAIKRSEPAVLCPSADGRACTNATTDTIWEQGYMLYVDRNENRERDVDEPVIRVFDVDGRLAIRSSRYRDHVSYLPNGMASGTNATFVICHPAYSELARAIIVSNTGRARVSSRLPDGGAIVCPGTS